MGPATVYFLGPLDEVLESREVMGPSAQPRTAQGTFRTAGKGAVVVHCVTDQGVSSGRRLELAVGP